MILIRKQKIKIKLKNYINNIDISLIKFFYKIFTLLIMFLLNYFRTPEIIDKVNKNTKEIPIYLSE